MFETEAHFKEFQAIITLLILNNGVICKHKGENRKCNCFM